MIDPRCGPCTVFARIIDGRLCDANGDGLATCDCCGRIYREAEVDAAPWWSCECGRLGQRFDGNLIVEEIVPINNELENR